MDGDNTIKITLEGKLNYADEITVSQAAQIIAFIDNAVAGPRLAEQETTLAPAALSTGTASTTATTPRDALDASGARTNPEKILTFAGLIQSEGREVFTLEDIRPLFRRAREATPKNLNRDFDTLIRSGWADESSVKGEFYITKKGFTALGEGFIKEKAGRSGTGSSRTSSVKKPRKPMETPKAFADIDPIPSAIDEVPNYSRLTTGMNRFLWVLYLAQTLNIDGLDNKEVTWVTDHLGAGIPATNIARTFLDAQKQGYANRSTQTRKFRISPPGIKRLKAIKQAAE